MPDFIGTFNCSITVQFKSKNEDTANDYMQEIQDDLDVTIRPSMGMKSPLKMRNAIDTAAFEIDDFEVEEE